MLRKVVLAGAVLSATLLSMVRPNAREWVLLGTAEVGFIADHDTVKVGKHEGQL